MRRPAHSIRMLLLMLLAVAPLDPRHELAAAQEATPAIATPGAATPVPLPTTPAGDQLAWLVDRLNAGATAFTPEDVEAHFAPSFLEDVPAADLAPDLSGLGTEIGPVVPTELDRSTTEFMAGAIVQA